MPRSFLILLTQEIYRIGGEFVRRTPDEYEMWVNGVTKECTVLEIEILKDLVSRTKKKYLWILIFQLKFYMKFQMKIMF